MRGRYIMGSLIEENGTLTHIYGNLLYFFSLRVDFILVDRQCHILK